MRNTPPEPFQPDLDILVTELASFLRNPRRSGAVASEDGARGG